MVSLHYRKIVIKRSKDTVISQYHRRRRHKKQANKKQKGKQKVKGSSVERLKDLST